MHDLEPCDVEKEPAGQKLQGFMPLLEFWPAGHGPRLAHTRSAVEVHGETSYWVERSQGVQARQVPSEVEVQALLKKKPLLQVVQSLHALPSEKASAEIRRQ